MTGSWPVGGLGDFKIAMSTFDGHPDGRLAWAVFAGAGLLHGYFRQRRAREWKSKDGGEH
jgi:hypothetical protein